MKQQLLLLKDVESLGKKGELVSAKPGYMRNYLLPQGCAVVASPNTLRKQERLRAERQQQAIIDRRASEELATKVEGIIIEIRVKVDPEGHMYGSVSAADIAQLFQEKGLAVDKKNIALSRPIKETGVHKLSLRLQEGVVVSANLIIIPEGIHGIGLETVVAPLPDELKEGKSEISE